MQNLAAEFHKLSVDTASPAHKQKQRSASTLDLVLVKSKMNKLACAHTV